jgi:hypothetical protein
MTRSEIINLEFRGRTLRPYGITILTPSDAVAMIRRAERDGVGILGIDGFILHPDGGTQPSMEHSCDYSVYGHPTESVWSDAVAFVEKNAAFGLTFEIVLDGGIPSEKTPNQSSDPAFASGTSRAGHEPRHR